MLPKGKSAFSVSSDPRPGIHRRESVPRGRRPGRPAAPPSQMPHAADTWSRLQCGARAPEGRAGARSGRDAHCALSGWRIGGNSALAG